MKTPTFLSLLLLKILATNPIEGRLLSSTPLTFVDRPPKPSALSSNNISTDVGLDDDDAIILRQAAQVGIVTAAMGHIYGQILDRTVKFVWHTLPNTIMQRQRTSSSPKLLGPSYIAYTLTIGGLLVGILSVKLKPAFVVAQYVSSLSRTSNDYDYGSGNDDDIALPNLMPYLPNLLILSLVTSTFGFSVGPEAPMVCAGGLIGMAMARNWYTDTSTDKGTQNDKRDEEIMTYAGSAGALTAFMGIPLAGPIFALELTRASAGLSSAARYALGPAVAASAAGLILLRGILAPNSKVGGHFTYASADVLTGRAAIITSLVCGAGGAVLAAIFHKLVHALKVVLWKETNNTSGENKGAIYNINREILVKTVIGIAVGILSMLYPATLFWGEGSLQCVIDGHQTPFANTKHGIPDLLTDAALVNPNMPFRSSWNAAQVGCAKLLSIALACAGKFPGGIIFPLFFAAAPIAHAVLSFLSNHNIIPEAVTPVAVMSLMAATQASVTRTPLATVLMLTLSASSATELSKMLPAVILASYFGVWFSQVLSEESYFDYS